MSSKVESLRLKKSEQKDLYNKYIEINKIRLAMNLPPFTESEIAHFILEYGIRNLTVNKEGEISI